MRQSNSRRDLRELRPQRETARQTIADNANAQGLYQARTAADKVIQDQGNADRAFTQVAERDAAAIAQNANTNAFRDAREGTRQAELTGENERASQVGKLTTVFNKETGEPTDVNIDFNGKPFHAGTEQPFNMAGYTTNKPDKKAEKNATEVKAYGKLKEDETSRLSSIDKAAKLLHAYKSGAKSGTSRSILNSVVPGQYTDQAAFDQEVEAFAELAARARLKAMGEIRPTDPDVAGAKASLFGIGKGEQVNINLITEYLQEQIATENNMRLMDGSEPMAFPENPPLAEDEWYSRLFEANGKTVARTGVDSVTGRRVVQYSDGTTEQE